MIVQRWANEQMFKGDFWMAQRLRNGVVSLQGHDGEFTVVEKHGLIMGISELPRIFSSRRYIAWHVPVVLEAPAHLVRVA